MTISATTAIGEVSRCPSYYRARYYNPTTGRFLSEDPMGFAGSGTNIYAYAANNPISFSDPSGLNTGQIGLSGSGTFFGFGVFGSVGLATDDQGNVGWYYSGGLGAGVGVGLSGSLGVSGAYSNAQNISDLAGPFGNVSATLGAGLGGTADLFFGPSADGGVVGGGVTAGLAGGASASTSVTWTSMHPFWNPFNPSSPGGGGGNGGGGCSLAARKC